MVTEESNSGLDWETEESWWRTPAAIGFIIGVALGFIVLLVFLGAVGRNPGNLGIPKSRDFTPFSWNKIYVPRVAIFAA